MDMWNMAKVNRSNVDINDPLGFELLDSAGNSFI